MSFNTLAAARTLEDAGIDSAQAEAITETIRVAVDGNAATKAGLTELKEATKANLAELKEALTWRIFLIVGGLLALVTALNRLLG